MKLTVSFGDTKVVVPCGSGDITIRDLAFSALKRAKHTFPKLDIHDRIVVHNVTIARDGGILDWEDMVRDVLDDRELVVAHYSIATLSNSTERRRSHLLSNEPLFPHLCTPLVVDLCSDSGLGGSCGAPSGPQSNEAIGTNLGVGGQTHDLCTGVDDRRPEKVATMVTVFDDCRSASNSCSSSSLSLNLNSDLCAPGHLTTVWTNPQTLTCPTSSHTVFAGFPCSSHPTPQCLLTVDPHCPHRGDHGIHTWTSGDTRQNSQPMHRALSPNTFAAVSSTLCKRRECFQLNWDADSEFDDDELDATLDRRKSEVGELHDVSSQTPTFPTQLEESVHLLTLHSESGQYNENVCRMPSTEYSVHGDGIVQSEQGTLETWPLPSPPPTPLLFSLDTSLNTTKVTQENVGKVSSESSNLGQQVSPTYETSTYTFPSHSTDSAIFRAPSDSAYSVDWSISHLMFTGVPVPPILEEDEEVSVDYDSSAIHSSLHRSGSPPVNTSTSLLLEDDYPKLRQDYKVTQESGILETNHNSSASMSSLMSRDQKIQNIPSVIRWLESTSSLMGTSSNPTALSEIGSSSSTLPTSSGPLNEAVGFSEPYPGEPGMGLTMVHLYNQRHDENLGIQIKPVYVDYNKLSVEEIKQLSTKSMANRIEFGLEIHQVMPNGRVARENCLFVGDRILTINGTSLTGVPFEKSRALFQAALSQPEITLGVLRHFTRMKLRQIQENSLTSRPESIIVRLTKSAPPPPPRRSPNTVLTQLSARATPVTDEPSTTCNDHICEITSSVLQASVHKPEYEYKSIELQKGQNGLGFSLTSRDVDRDQQHEPQRLVCVKSILPGGAALLDGRLRPGDNLIQVDGADVATLGQTRVVSLLRDKPIDSVISLLIRRSNVITPTHTNSDSAKSESVRSDLRDSDVSHLYVIHSIDPVQDRITELSIHLPVDETKTIDPNTSISPNTPSTPTNAVTLGVSVSVRPLHQTPNKPKVSTADNAVFVRTLIEGGAAWQDGRLRVGDRLLMIDNLPLSGISSSEALSRLKSTIAKDLSNKRPQIRLLISRPNDGTERSATTHDSAARFEQKMSGTTDKANLIPPLDSSSSAPPVPVKSSMLVSAEVHTSSGTQYPRQSVAQIRCPNAMSEIKPGLVIQSTGTVPSTGVCSDIHSQSTSKHKSTTQKQKDGSTRIRSEKMHIPSHHSSKGRNRQSRRPQRRHTTAKFTPTDHQSSITNMDPSRSEIPQPFEYHSDTVRIQDECIFPTGPGIVHSVQTVVPAPKTSTTQVLMHAPGNSRRIYRCDSQGTISSPDSSTSAASPHMSRGSKAQPGRVCSDPELRCGRDVKRSKHRAHSTTSQSVRDGFVNESGSYRVVYRQPRIDLSQLVLVPFHPDSWTGAVLKPRDALNEDELSCVVEPAARLTHPSDTLITHSVIPELSVPNPMLSTLYDSGGGTSRKGSQSSCNESHENVARKSKIINRFFKLVKNGTSRRASHSEATTQTLFSDLDAKDGRSYQSVPCSSSVSPESCKKNERRTNESIHPMGSSINSQSGLPSTENLKLSYHPTVASLPATQIHDMHPTNSQINPRPANVACTDASTSTDVMDRTSTTYAELSFTNHLPNEPNEIKVDRCHDSFKPGQFLVVNRIQDFDTSSCSTVYESVLEFQQSSDEIHSPKQKSQREVFEDAEQLYRYLSEMRKTKDDNNETDTDTSPDTVN